MRHQPIMTSADTHKIMAACKAEAHKNRLGVSIAIVDANGILLQFERLDGAGGISATVAIGKAQAAATSGMPSKVLGNLAKEIPGILMLPVGLALQGGVPVMHQGECVGAVGVSGAQGDEDEHVASVGAAVMA